MTPRRGTNHRAARRFPAALDLVFFITFDSFFRIERRWTSQVGSRNGSAHPYGRRYARMEISDVLNVKIFGIGCRMPCDAGLMEQNQIGLTECEQKCSKDDENWCGGFNFLSGELESAVHISSWVSIYPANNHTPRHGLRRLLGSWVLVPSLRESRWSQGVDATLAWSLLSGVSKPNVFLGR